MNKMDLAAKSIQQAMADTPEDHPDYASLFSKRKTVSKLPMTWIESALVSGTSTKHRREMTLIWDSEDQHFTAVLHFRDLDQTLEGIGTTPQEAISALESAILDDAADEMIESGTV